MQIQISAVESRTLFGDSDWPAQGMIAWLLPSFDSENPKGPGRRKVIDSDREKKLMQFCLVRQSEKTDQCLGYN
jgi:hypothetical protein